MLGNAQIREEPSLRGLRRATVVVAAMLVVPAPSAAASTDAAVVDPGPAVEEAVAPLAGGAVEPVAVPAAGSAPAPAAGDPTAAAVIGTGAVVGALPPLPAGVPDVTAFAAACPGAGSRPARASATTLRRAVHCLVNHARAGNGMRALHGDARLARAARNHARDMVRRHYFAHQRIGGRSLTGRARAAGWRGSALGEAIAYGCGRPATAAATVRAWLESPGHRAILLSRSYRRVGIGLAKRAPVACGGGATWVLDAGRG
jgi:uncharacterized protein YkwD